MAEQKFVFLDAQQQDKEVSRPSLTYWQDAWRRLKKHKMAMVGIVTITLIVLFAVIGPFLTPVTYSDQSIFRNLPPSIDYYRTADGINLYLSKDYNMFLVDDKGHFVKRLEQVDKDIINKVYTYAYGEGDAELIELDFSYNTVRGKEGYDYNHTVTYKGETLLYTNESSWNKSYPFGTDNLGRDILTRVMYGTRISLIIALVATMVNLFIGVVYGSIAGFEGGSVDNVMMRIVDIINSVPLVLYVILLMVTFRESDGLTNIIIALGSVYWVSMARLVRGQMLSIKEQEFILAARVIGVPKKKIIMRHLIPNAMGPIIVSMTMMIPSAIFTEAFLSFIGLGVPAPLASLGTLANDGLAGLLTYPYQLFIPSLTIAVMMLAFNFIGDGLRDALDPRLRKG